MKEFFSEFKAFAMRGNVIDLAVGVIIGGAFGKIVSSFINDVVMPPIGLLLGGVDFKDLKILLKAGSSEGDKVIDPVFLSYGGFINTVVEFVIIAFVIFLAVKGMNRLTRKDQEEKAAVKKPSEDIVLLTEIRDLLRK
ncbi:MAG: large-conductance mechanosensitive channel [Ignavibacteriaceae bacterium]|nr:MAG: large-conductance mechanosensitive channel protein MscL [Chlorobiota bacterium]GJQ31702.1 MAG: large-conductance mechanosensitive channel [Ignavibacteriaceae bacterium]